MTFSPRWLVLGSLAAILAAAAPAHAQVPSATVRSIEDSGLRFVGGNGDNNVRFSITGEKFVIDDVVPIEAGAGCLPVAGDPTKVTCVAFKQGNKFKEFQVLSGNGNDRVVNRTSSTTTTGAPMNANGGPGDDTLIGDIKTHDTLAGAGNNDQLQAIGGLDELDGGSGDDKVLGGVGGDELRGGTGNDVLDGGGSDDVLDGGTGRDIIDGGPAGISSGERHDRVIYADRTVPVTVDLNRIDASQGSAGESDTILDVEDIVGGSAGDFLFGNAFANTISGGAGNDAVSGKAGRDVLVGDDGADTIFPSPGPNVQFPFGVVPDGEPDLIECGQVGRSDGDAGDQAFRVLVDGDLANDCATVVNQ